jgi:hypothetical protein
MEVFNILKEIYEIIYKDISKLKAILMIKNRLLKTSNGNFLMLMLFLLNTGKVIEIKIFGKILNFQ